MSTSHLGLLALLISAAPGCALDSEGLFSADAETAVLMSSLQQSQAFTVTPTAQDPDSGGFITVAGSWVDGPAGTSYRLTVNEGFATVEADAEGQLWLEALRIELGDLIVGDGTTPPHGARLTALTVVLDAPAQVDAHWSLGRASGAAAVDLDFDWALHIPSGPASLASQQLETVPAEVEIWRGEQGELELQLGVVHEDTIWQLAPVLSLEAVYFDVKGQTAGREG